MQIDWIAGWVVIILWGPNLKILQNCAMVSLYSCTYSKHKLFIWRLVVSRYANRADGCSATVLMAARSEQYVRACLCVCVCVRVCVPNSIVTVQSTRKVTRTAQKQGAVRICKFVYVAFCVLAEFVHMQCEERVETNQLRIWLVDYVVITKRAWNGELGTALHLTLSQLMLHICRVSKTFGEW
jgi:hypothetical protein